jgi:enoyl-CoA hydratase
MSSHEISSNLLLEYRNQLAIITINRAGVRNTLSTATITEFINLLIELKPQKSIAVIIVHGLGEAFSAGADIKELLALNAFRAVDFSRHGAQLFNAIRLAPQLVIAAIDGYCMGGGLDLALACDLRYATKQAVFAHPGAKIGIITGFGGTRRLPLAIGRKDAEQLLITCESIDGQRALAYGLVQALAHSRDIMEFTLKQAKKMVLQGAEFIAELKTAVRLVTEAKHHRADLLLTRYLELCKSNKKGRD